MGYSFLSFPTIYDDILSVNYYDDYSFDLEGKTYSGTEQLSQRTEGLPTGSLIKILNSNPAIYLTSITYYNKEGLPVQSWSENMVGGWTKSTIEYNWKGRVTKSTLNIEFEANDDSPVKIENTFEYDKTGRLLKTYQKTGNDAQILLSELEYNLLDQIIKKKIHKPLGYSEFMQIVDYRYNEKGWLTKINNAELAVDYDNEEDYDVFGEELIYSNDQLLDDQINELSTTGMTLTPTFDGSIAMMEWKVKAPESPQNEDGFHAYIMRYDEMGRQTNACYAKSDAFGKLTQQQGFWNEKVSYSMAGNITSIKRYRPNAEDLVPELYDGLDFKYANTNRLTKLRDVANNTTNEEFTQFIDPSNGLADVDDTNNPEYSYDIMGRLSHDSNKNFTYSYNLLGQVAAVDDGPEHPDCVFTYDASGSKLKKQVGENITYYIGGAEFKGDGKLISVPTSEGVVRPNDFTGANQPEYVYDYYLADHLGNERVILTDENSPDITEIATYEPPTLPAEELQFENVSGPITTTPINWPGLSGFNQKVISLSTSGYVMGTSYIAKVKIGERISVNVESYYDSDDPNTTTGQTLLQILGNMLVNINIHGQGVLPPGENGIGVFSNASSTQSMSIANFLNSNISTLYNGQPNANLIYVYFDKRLMVVPSYSGIVPVGSPNLVNILQMAQRSMPKDGYFFTFVTNQSPRKVFFNNLTIVREQGIIRSVNDYYPYGLTWNNLPSEELRNAGYQGKDWQSKESDGFSLELYDFHARMYDPTLGRWLVPDPANQHFSLYLAMGNRPIQSIDPDGMWAIDPNDIRMNYTGSVNSVYINDLPDQIYVNSALNPNSYTWMGGYNANGTSFFSDKFYTGSFRDNYYALRAELERNSINTKYYHEGYYGNLTPRENNTSPTLSQKEFSKMASGMPTGSFSVASNFTQPTATLSQAFMSSSEKFFLGWKTLTSSGALGGPQSFGSSMLYDVVEGGYVASQQIQVGFGKPQGDIYNLTGQNLDAWDAKFQSCGFLFTVVTAGEGVSLMSAGKTGMQQVAKGGGSLVNLTEETFSQALFKGAENVGGYSVYGTKGLVGNTFNRNIFLLEASGGKSLSGFRSFVGSIEAEALGAGANKISIYGSSVINKGFLNPKIAARFGYTFEQSGSGVFLQKVLR